MEDALDTVRTTAVGFSGHLVSKWDYLPDMVSVAVGGVTIVYLGLKIYLTIMELRDAKESKKSNSNAR
jgi:hypothetical protein|tara:strand:- start:1494 stop:1697 length:204 start_codon:yes stop_codon:yes gene_type:complete